MGMFDYLECLYPLPDHWEPQGRLFQTHDTPAQQLGSDVLNAGPIPQPLRADRRGAGPGEGERGAGASARDADLFGKQYLRYGALGDRHGG
jgi:hypothetical protein